MDPLIKVFVVEKGFDVYGGGVWSRGRHSLTRLFNTLLLKEQRGLSMSAGKLGSATTTKQCLYNAILRKQEVNQK